MEQQASTNKSHKQRTKSLELQTSKSHCLLTSRRSEDNNYPLSEAERYISIRSQMTLDSNEQQDILFETHSTRIPSLKKCNTISINSPLSYTGIMHDWHRRKANEIYKKEPHRYIYGSSPPSSSEITSPAQILFRTFTNSNYLSSQRTDSQIEEHNTRASISSSHMDFPRKK